MQLHGLRHQIGRLQVGQIRFVVHIGHAGSIHHRHRADIRLPRLIQRSQIIKNLSFLLLFVSRCELFVFVGHWSLSQQGS
ncbi:MAG: hypothetical protein HQL95_13515 [Magnetococcales bacterium]|nr:hypothetical protein [Magnetococcales bacterium]